MKRLAFFLALLLFAFTVPATAGVTIEESKVLDRFTARVGGFLTGLSTDLRVDGPGGRGTTINLEDDLGFDSSITTPRISMAYILGQRHQINLGYFTTDRESTVTLEDEIRWEDLVFPVRLDVKAFYNMDFLTVGYTYWFYSSEKTALGVTGNLVFTELESGLEARFQVGDPILDPKAELSTGVPVPQLGFSVYHYLGKKFVVKGLLAYLTFSDVEGYSGDISNAALSFEHRTWKNFGFGAGYGFTRYDIDADDLDFLGNFNYDVSGFEFYVRAAF